MEIILQEKSFSSPCLLTFLYFPAIFSWLFNTRKRLGVKCLLRALRSTILDKIVKNFLACENSCFRRLKISLQVWKYPGNKYRAIDFIASNFFLVFKSDIETRLTFTKYHLSYFSRPFTNSLRSWRYCLGARFRFWGRSRDPKKGVGTRRLKYLFLAAYAARDGFAAKLNLTRLLHNTAGYAG